MSLFSRLFGSKPEPDPVDLETRLNRLERQAAQALPGYVGTSFNRAGDLARREGALDLAVRYYGRAIDAFLEDGQREAARGVANKIIRVRPNAVRTLCTLTWLDLSAGHLATALLHLRDYVEAVARNERRAITAGQVYEMARIVPEAEFIAAVADSLDQLDFAGRAAEVREWAKEDGSPDAIRDRQELAVACLRHAIRSKEHAAMPLRDLEAEDTGPSRVEGG